MKIINRILYVVLLVIGVVLMKSTETNGWGIFLLIYIIALASYLVINSLLGYRRCKLISLLFSNFFISNTEFERSKWWYFIKTLIILTFFKETKNLEPESHLKDVSVITYNRVYNNVSNYYDQMEVAIGPGIFTGWYFREYASIDAKHS